METKLVLIILAVSDLPRAVEFYQRAFGWPVRVQVPVYVELEMPGGQRLGLYHHEGFGRNTGRPAALAPAGRTTGTELYFYAPDVPAALARLEAAGATVLSPLQLRPWSDEAAYFADPDGNVVVIARSPAASS
jgi:catechol 2,3-dioxygenase-like lactoylglutathione lyase family enzyme